MEVDAPRKFGLTGVSPCPSLDSAGKQLLADSLAIYRRAQPAMLPTPRALVGSTLAPVRITEFTDILCEHCAGLYETLQTLRGHTAPGSYRVDARQFPLDGRCNSRFETGKGDDSDGTPIVAVNGRRGTSFENPAFDPLPPGNASAHLH